uniref:Cleavage and polyadenylation specificity factor subunit 4 n=1 Tax=Geotrypetes seraphini TaxID=260995 RepID=A0A6P8SLU3_GEOSA|nr:putative cleavage and polyadenylation specificity factor subunit 4-like protein isoform X4 [Geotrypetes seraphini]
MQDLIARVEKITFQLETDVLEQTGAVLLPFQGMDKSGTAVCEFFIKGQCRHGLMCPFRHVSGEKTVVCKHWLRGLCKKGDQCEFLHEYDMTKMPECFFYSKFGECSNKECPFLHIDPALKIKDCPWYDRGFCKHGPACKHRHTRRIMCVNYLAGFCPEGPKCKFVQPQLSPRDCKTSLSSLATFWRRAACRNRRELRLILVEHSAHWSRSPVLSVEREAITLISAAKVVLCSS